MALSHTNTHTHTHRHTHTRMYTHTRTHTQTHTHTKNTPADLERLNRNGYGVFDGDANKTESVGCTAPPTNGVNQDLKLYLK